MSDLELGMNEQVCDKLVWDDKRIYDKGKVLTAKELDEIEKFGRYQDVDNDGIPYRTYPGTHPNKGSYFTRGSSHDGNAAYTEDGDVYAEVMDRIALKFESALNYIPQPEISDMGKSRLGMVFLGTTASAIQEVLDSLEKKGISLDTLRIKSFPFHDNIKKFIDSHALVYVIEQNRDAQLKSLLKIELNANEDQLHSILSYNGILITAQHIEREILESMLTLEATKDVPA